MLYICHNIAFLHQSNCVKCSKQYFFFSFARHLTKMPGNDSMMLKRPELSKSKSIDSFPAIKPITFRKLKVSLCESPTQINSSKAYLEKEHKRRKEIIKVLKIKDHLQMDACVERDLQKSYGCNSFYAVHILMRYQSKQISKSYVQPSTRIGEHKRPNSSQRRHQRYDPQNQDICWRFVGNRLASTSFPEMA